MNKSARTDKSTHVSEKGRGSVPKKNDRLDSIRGPAQCKV